MSERCQTPKVTYITGPMSAGKTEKLHTKMGEFDSTHIHYVALKPIMDVRDAGIKPRGMSAIDGHECIGFDQLGNVDIESLVLAGIDTAVVDEAHMAGFDMDRQPLSDVYLPTMERWKRLGIVRVFMAGLDVAANGDRFRMYTDAKDFGAKIVHLTAKCEYPIDPDENRPTCREVAKRSQIFELASGKPFYRGSLPSILPAGSRDDIGFRPVCQEHYALLRSDTIDFS